MRTTFFVAAVLGLALVTWLVVGQRDQKQSRVPPDHAADTSVDSPSTQPELAVPPAPVTSHQPMQPDRVEPASDTCMAAGIVVDAKRRPVAGASVVATFKGRESGATRSAGDGTFEVALLPRGDVAHVGRLVIRKDNHGAVRVLYLGPYGGDRVDYGRITLAPTHAVTVRVIRDGTPIEGAQVVLGQTKGARHAAQFTIVRSDAKGLARFEHALGPRVGIHACAERTGRAHREVELPVTGSVDIELPKNRQATLRVERGDTGAPVPNAEIFLGGGGTRAPPAGTGCLPPYPELRTDEDGVLIVSGLPEKHVWVVARASNLGMRNQGMMVERVILQPGETEKTVKLYPYRAVRFPIANTGAGAPPEGTPMKIRRYQPLAGYDVGHPEARIEDGHLVLEPFPPGHDWGHVATDDGHWAKWTAGYDKDLGDPVEFRTIYDARVRLTWRDGSPATNQLLWANLRPRGQSEKLRTDKNGEVLFPRLIAEAMTVLWTPSKAGFGMPIGSVSLVADPGVQTLTIDRPIAIELALRRGGKPFIPDGVEVRVPDSSPNGQPGSSRTLYREVEEDVTSGILRFRWLPMPDGTAPPVTVRGKTISEKTVTPKKANDGVWRANVELTQGATLRVRIAKPEGGRYFLQMERWVDAERRWRNMHDHPSYQKGRRAVDGVHTFPTLTPGRYRLVEGYTTLASDPIDIKDRDVEVAFDLTSIVLVKGRVQVPDGESPAYAAIHVKGRTQGQVSTSNPARVMADGTFEFRAPRGEQLTLTAQHPLLQVPGDPAAFVVGQTDPVIRFEQGPHLVFRIRGSDVTTREPNMNSFPAWWSPIQVRIREPGKWDSGGRSYAAIAKNGKCRCAVPNSGTWTVRIEQPGFVPLLLEDTKIGSGPTDLGTLELSKGSTLTVRLTAGDSGLPQNLQVTAVRQGAHPYSCFGAKIEAGDPPTVQLTGLGPGTFKVSVQKMYVKGNPLVETIVESDGASPLAVDVTLP